MVIPRFVFLCAALCLACTPGSAQDAGAETQRHFLAARQAQAAGRLEVAAREYAEVLRLQPGLAEVHANLGLVYHLGAKYEESARALEKAISLKPGLRGVSLFLGIDYAKLNRPRQAVLRLKEAVQQEPANKEARTWLGTALWDDGQAAAAVRELRRAAADFPSDPDILFLLGQAYRNRANDEVERVLSAVGTPLYHQVFGDIYTDQRKWDKAADHYRRAAEKAPRLAGSHLGLGEVCFRQGKWDDAKQEYRQELGVDAASPAALARLAQIEILAGDIPIALRTLADAIRNGPERAADMLGLPPAPFFGSVEPVSDAARDRYRQALPALGTAPEGAARSLALAAVYLRLGLERESQAQWREFPSAAAATVPDPHRRALAAFHRHEYEAAESALEALLAASPADREARYLLGRTFERLSLGVLGRMLSIDPGSARAHQLLAQTYDQQEQNDKALAEYRTVVQLNPSLSGVHFAIGHLLWKTGEAERAIPELQQELRLNPGHCEANAEIGTILVRQHQADQAIPFLNRALQLKPGLALARQQLARALFQQKEFVRAERELKGSLSPDPDGNVRYLLGMVYREMGRTGEATAAFAEARRIKSERLAERAIAPAGEPLP